jgi:rare lipoprotein A
MPYPSRLLWTLLLASAVPAVRAADAAGQDLDPRPPPRHAAAAPERTSHLDRSGQQRIGKASIYARRLAGRKMADGTRLELHGDNAASKTLPLGTTAVVTNLATGRTAVVTIRDRGPFVKGRIVDLSPATAGELGLKGGVARVAVTPIDVPPGNLTR